MVHISTDKDAQGVCIIVTPALALATLVAHSAFQGSNNFIPAWVCLVPFTAPGSRETIVDKTPRLWVYAPSGIRTHDPLITSREHEPLHHSAPTNEAIWRVFPLVLAGSHVNRQSTSPARMLAVKQKERDMYDSSPNYSPLPGKLSFQFHKTCMTFFIYHQLRSRRELSLFKDVPLRT